MMYFSKLNSRYLYLPIGFYCHFFFLLLLKKYDILTQRAHLSTTYQLIIVTFYSQKHVITYIIVHGSVSLLFIQKSMTELTDIRIKFEADLLFVTLFQLFYSSIVISN